MYNSISLRGSRSHSYHYYRIVVRVLNNNLNLINQFCPFIFICKILSFNYFHFNYFEITNANCFNMFSFCNMNHNRCNIILFVIHVFFCCNSKLFRQRFCVCEIRRFVFCKTRNTIIFSCVFIRKQSSIPSHQFSHQCI